MNRVFDPIDIIFMALISLYFVILFVIVLLWYLKKDNNYQRYQVIKVEKPIHHKVVKVSKLPEKKKDKKVNKKPEKKKPKPKKTPIKKPVKKKTTAKKNNKKKPQKKKKK